jgi:hypothetical protein
MSQIQDFTNYIADNTELEKGTNLFIGIQPDTSNDLVAVYDTGGPTPDTYLPTATKTFQVLVRAKEYTDCLEVVNEIVSLLHQLRNEELGDTYFYYAYLMGEPAHIGQDDKARHEFSMNFLTKTRR